MSGAVGSAARAIQTYGIAEGTRKISENVYSIVWLQFWSIPLLEEWSYNQSVARLKQLQSNENSLDDALETRRKYGGMGLYKTIQANQIFSEERRLIEFVSSRGPRTVVEIGTEWGGTLYPWCRPFTPPQTVISIDMGYLGRRPEFYHAFTAASNAELELIDGNSHDESTRKRLEDVLGENRADFLFIDGDHTYEGVKEDFETYNQYVRDGGLVAFHDINGDHNKCGVGRFWKEIKSEHDTTEFVSDPSAIWNGIGVVEV